MDADSPMSEHQEQLMAGYVLNSLSPEETAEVEQQLRTNPALEEELKELREVMGLMAYQPPIHKAPTQLRTRIL